jgi:hypothetical protein
VLYILSLRSRHSPQCPPGAAPIFMHVQNMRSSSFGTLRWDKGRYGIQNCMGASIWRIRPAPNCIMLLSFTGAMAIKYRNKKTRRSSPGLSNLKYRYCSNGSFDFCILQWSTYIFTTDTRFRWDHVFYHHS